MWLKATVNPIDDDKECSKWEIYPPRNHPEQITKILKSNSEKLNWEGVVVPVQLTQN